MSVVQLNQRLLDNAGFWDGKGVLLPGYDRKLLPVKSVSFAAGRMAYGHTADILQDILNAGASDAGLMTGVETYSKEYSDSLARADYLATQLIFGDERGEVVPKIQGAIKKVVFVEADRQSTSWAELAALARDPQVQFATINAPEGAYGVSYGDGDFAEVVDPRLAEDLDEGTVTTDPAKWTAFALERFKAGLRFALVSCTNFSGNGHHTGATVRTVGRAWENGGHAPRGFVDYLSDPARFSFPNTMIDRIAVAPDENSRQVLQRLGLESNVVVTEKCRYWAVEDVFAGGRPPFEMAEGVFMCPDYDDVKRYEDMKLRILNMSHSVMAGVGVLLGYKGPYGIYRAMQDADVAALIRRIINIALRTVAHPKQMDPADFARDTLARLDNPNIPDDPMRIAFNCSTKMKPRFIDTYFEALKRGIVPSEAEVVLVPVAGFLRYTLCVDDAGRSYEMEKDPLKELLARCGRGAEIGRAATAASFAELIAHRGIMGVNLYTREGAGMKLQEIAGDMIEGLGAVRKTVRKYVGQ